MPIMATVKCLTCDKEMQVYNCRIIRGEGKYCSRECAKIGHKGKRFSPNTEFKKGCKPETGPNHQSWNGGRHLDHRGYVLIRIGRKYVREHRHIVEQAIGRPLLSTEVVDHINGIKDDNRLENLRLFVSQKSHVEIETERGKYIGSHKNQLRNNLGRFTNG